MFLYVSTYTKLYRHGSFLLEKDLKVGLVLFLSLDYIFLHNICENIQKRAKIYRQRN